MKSLNSLTTGDSEITRDGTGKEWSDEVARNLSLLRLGLSGISILFDSQYMAEGQPASDSPSSEEKEGGSPDEPLGESGEEECQPTRRYPAGYAFQSSEDPLYIQVHQLRDRIGRMLHQVHQFLTSKQEDDVACFNALYTVSNQIRFFHSSNTDMDRLTGLGLLMSVSNVHPTSWTESIGFSMPTLLLSKSVGFGNVTHGPCSFVDHSSIILSVSSTTLVHGCGQRWIAFCCLISPNHLSHSTRKFADMHRAQASQLRRSSSALVH